jgi:hypothetical protein
MLHLAAAAEPPHDRTLDAPARQQGQDELRRETIEALRALQGLHDPESVRLRAHLRGVLAEIGDGHDGAGR